MNQDSFEKELIRLGFILVVNINFINQYKLILDKTSITVTYSVLVGYTISINNNYIIGYNDDYTEMLSIINTELRSFKLKKLLNESR